MAWTLDPHHTTVGFSAKHLGLSTVRGKFRELTADIELDDEASPTSAKGRVVVKAASLDTGDEQRDGHLRSADFFDVENHPEIVFEAKSVTHKGDDEYDVVGDLTIKGITKEVALLYEHSGIATDPYGNVKVGGNLTGTITRADWDLKWNVPLGSGGLLVSETIKIEVEGQLAKSKDAVEEAAAAETQTTA
jgi:polyisoprenoid-binding protein YceI